MSGLRQHIQRQLAREPSERGEAPITGVPEAEPVVAVAEPESPAATMLLMEEVCERENLVRAWQRVRDNKGAPGACQDTRHFRRHCAIPFSTLSACLAFTLRVEAQPGRTAEVRDPYARWCGRGGAVRRPPIPINGTNSPYMSTEVCVGTFP